MSGRAAGRPGIALLMTLLGVLVLEVVIAGAFHVVMQQRRIATSYTRGVQLEHAARAAAAAVLAQWAGLGTDSLAVGAEAVVAAADDGGAHTAATLLRVAPELFLLRAEAQFTATGETRAVAALLRELTLGEFLSGIRAAAVAGTAAVVGTLDGTPPSDCDLPAGAPAEVSAILVADDGAEGGDTTGARNAFSQLSGLDLGALADAPPGLIVHPGDLTLAADVDEAAVVVHGDLVVEDGVRVRGLVLVGGALLLRPGASVHGAVQVGGRLTVEQAAIRYDPCVLAALFRARPALRGPLRAAPHWWIPAA